MQIAEEIEKPLCGARFDTKLAHCDPETARQIEWEHEGVARGVRAYRDAEAAAFERGDVSALAPVQRVMRQLAVPLAAAITTLQDDAEGRLSGFANGRPPVWGLEVMSLSPEKLAVITLSSALRAVLAGPAEAAEASTRQVAVAISRAIQAELQYEGWVNAEDTDPVLVKRLRRRYPDLDRRTWKKWVKKIGLLTAAPWDNETCIQVGSALLAQLVETSEGMIEIRDVRTDANSSMSMLVGTEELTQMLQDRKTRVEMARPKLLPMVVPPKPWTN